MIKLEMCTNTGLCSACGGTIISESYVLTAAHCVTGFSTFYVIAGSHDVTSIESSRVTIVSNTTKVHPNWNPTLSLEYDIALIELPTQLVFNQYIKPLCLSNYTSSVGEHASAMGWGLTVDGGSVSPTLQVAHGLPIMSNADASLVYGPLSNGIVCIDTSGLKGTCNVSSL